MTAVPPRSTTTATPDGYERRRRHELLRPDGLGRGRLGARRRARPHVGPGRPGRAAVGARHRRPRATTRHRLRRCSTSARRLRKTAADARPAGAQRRHRRSSTAARSARPPRRCSTAARPPLHRAARRVRGPGGRLPREDPRALARAGQRQADVRQPDPGRLQAGHALTAVQAARDVAALRLEGRADHAAQPLEPHADVLRRDRRPAQRPKPRTPATC